MRHQIKSRWTNKGKKAWTVDRKGNPGLGVVTIENHIDSAYFQMHPDTAEELALAILVNVKEIRDGT